MAIFGLSIPVCGEYTNSEGTVSYSNGFIANKAIEYSVTISSGDDNPLYADNGIAENDKGTFQSGELTLGTADLPQDLSVKLLGSTVISETTGSGESAVTTNVEYFGDERKSPYLGFGIIEAHQIDDVKKYKAVFFNKVYFNIPEDAATTKGESIDWQTKTITGVIQRSDEVVTSTTSSGTVTVSHPWKESAWFETESAALAWLSAKVGISA